MKEKISLLDVPDEVLHQNLLVHLSEQDLLLLSRTSKKSRDLVAMEVCKSKPPSHENMLEQYLSFWLNNLNFISRDKKRYQEFLETCLREKQLNNLQKINVYILLRFLYSEDKNHENYYSALLSLLKMRYPILVDFVELIVNAQAKINLPPTDNLAEVFKAHIIENPISVNKKLFLVNIFKYWNSPLASTTLDFLINYVKTNIESDSPNKQEKATGIIVPLSPIIKPQVRDDFINLLLTQCLFKEGVFIRKKALSALCLLTNSLLTNKLIPIIKKVVESVVCSDIQFINKEYALRFLSLTNLALLKTYNKTLIAFLLPKVQEKTEFNYGVRKESFTVLMRLLSFMSAQQLLEITCAFYALLGDMGMPDEAYRLADQGLGNLAKFVKETEVSKLIQSFSKKILPDKDKDQIARLRVLGHLSQHLSTQELAECLDKLFNFLIHNNQYIRMKAYVALKITLSNLVEEQQDFVFRLIQKKIGDNEFKMSQMGIKALAILLPRVPSRLIESVKKALLEKLKSQYFSVREEAINVLGALATCKNTTSTKEIVSSLIPQVSSENLKICEAAIQALTQFIPFMDEKVIKVQLKPLLFAHIKNKDKNVQATSLYAIAQLTGFIDSQEFTSLIKPVLLANIKDETEVRRIENILFAIEAFNKYLRTSEQEEFVQILIKNTANKQIYGSFLEKTLNTLSHLLNGISLEQQSLLENATSLKSNYCLINKKDRKLLNEDINHTIRFWEKLYSHQVKQSTAPYSFFSSSEKKDDVTLTQGQAYLSSYRPFH
jgi:HEAT repeat protein